MTIVLKPGLRLERDEIQKLVDDAVQPPRDEPASCYDALPGEGRLNKSVAEMQEEQRSAVQALHKEKHDGERARAKAKEKELLVSEKRKKLQSSGAASERGLSIDAHAKNWAEAETGEARIGKSWGGGRSKRIAQSAVDVS